MDEKLMIEELATVTCEEAADPFEYPYEGMDAREERD